MSDAALNYTPVPEEWTGGPAASDLPVKPVAQPPEWVKGPPANDNVPIERPGPGAGALRGLGWSLMISYLLSLESDDGPLRTSDPLKDPYNFNPLTGERFHSMEEMQEVMDQLSTQEYYRLRDELAEQMFEYGEEEIGKLSHLDPVCTVQVCAARDSAVPEPIECSGSPAAEGETNRLLPKALAEQKQEEEKKKRRYTVAVHAQGVDCGGKSSSTIGAPAITQPVPVTVFEGLALSAATQARLSQKQLEVRKQVILKAHNYIRTGPAKGGRFGKKSFPVLGVRGGIRYDVDCHGDGPSFVS